MTQAYPLQWPDHAARCPSWKRQRSRFDVTPDRARRDLRDEAKKIGTNIVISTNLELRRDGEPYANRRRPEDPGVAVYMMRKGRLLCLACDKHPEVWENMRAISKTIEAMRGIERWGTAEMMDQAFSGFEALPSPDTISPPPGIAWWEVLGITPGATVDEVNAAYKARARARGGASYELNEAREAALRVVGS